jgi:hypothetical protein
MTEFLYFFPAVFGRSKGNRFIRCLLKVTSFFGAVLITYRPLSITHSIAFEDAAFVSPGASGDTLFDPGSARSVGGHI